MKLYKIESEVDLEGVERIKEEMSVMKEESFGCVDCGLELCDCPEDEDGPWYD